MLICPSIAGKTEVHGDLALPRASVTISRALRLAWANLESLLGGPSVPACCGLKSQNPYCLQRTAVLFCMVRIFEIT